VFTKYSIVSPFSVTEADMFLKNLATTRPPPWIERDIRYYPNER